MLSSAYAPSLGKIYMYTNIKKIVRSSLCLSSLALGLVTSAYGEEAPAKHVKVDQVVEMSLAATTELSATLHSESHIPLTAGVNGKLHWLAQPGDEVERGDVVAKMELLPLQLKQAEQKAQIKRENINRSYLKKELARLEKLSKTNATSQFQLDQTRSEYELALADIEIAQLKLQQIEDQLQRATIVAPFSGVITQRLVRAGTDVNRSDVLLKLLDTEHLEARVYIPVKYLAFVNKGQKLTLTSDQQSIDAAITAKIPSADLRSQTFEIRISIPKQFNHIWAAGQLVRVTVPVQHTSPSITVHRDALILRKDGTYVVKIDKENKVQRLLVRVGKGTLERVSIQGDLHHGDKVAVRGAERLEDGQRVVIQ